MPQKPRNRGFAPRLLLCRFLLGAHGHDVRGRRLKPAVDGNHHPDSCYGKDFANTSDMAALQLGIRFFDLGWMAVDAALDLIFSCVA